MVLLVLGAQVWAPNTKNLAALTIYIYAMIWHLNTWSDLFHIWINICHANIYIQLRISREIQWDSTLIIDPEKVSLLTTSHYICDS